MRCSRVPAELEQRGHRNGSEQVLSGSGWLYGKGSKCQCSNMRSHASTQGASSALRDSGLSQQPARVAAPSRSVPRRRIGYPAPARRHVVLHEVRRSSGIFDRLQTAMLHQLSLRCCL